MIGNSLNTFNKDADPDRLSIYVQGNHVRKVPKIPF